MKQKLVPVLSSVPDSAFMGRWISKNYGLKGVSCILWEDGVNHTYKIGSRGSVYFLRVYRPGWRTGRQIDFELEQLRFLDQAGIPVASVLPARNKALKLPLLLPSGPTHAALFHAAPGKAPKDIPVLGRELGKVLARMHLVQKKFDRAPRLLALDEHGLVDAPVRLLAPFKASFGKQWPKLLRIAERIRRQLRQFRKETPYYGLIHGDPHSGNVSVNKDGKRYTYFDFDLTTKGWRLFDLATFIWDFSGNNKKKRSALRMMVRAYSKISPLELWELRSFGVMIAARHLWWMGFQASLARHGGRMVSREAHEWKMKLLKDWDSGKLDRELGIKRLGA